MGKRDVYPFCEAKVETNDKGATNAATIERYIEKVENEFEIEVGSIITDKAGQCAMAQRILKPRYPHIIFDFCWAHQFNLVCGVIVRKFYKLRSTFESDFKRVIQQFNSVEAFRREFLSLADSKYGKKLQRPLIPLCDTRFYTHYNSVSRILQYRFIILEIMKKSDVLGIFAGKNPRVKLPTDANERKRKMISYAESFIHDCSIFGVLLRPVAAAVLKFEKRGRNKADVMFQLIKLYLSFSSNHVVFSKYGVVDVVNAVKSDLCKRWHDCEQPLAFVTAALDLRYRSMICSMLQTEEGIRTNLGTVINSAAAMYYQRLNREDLSDEQRKRLGEELDRFVKMELAPGMQGNNSPSSYFKMSYIDEMKNSFIFPLGLRLVTSYCQTADCERQFSGYKRIQTDARSNISEEGMVALYQASVINRASCVKQKPRETLRSLFPLLEKNSALKNDKEAARKQLVREVGQDLHILDDSVESDSAREQTLRTASVFGAKSPTNCFTNSAVQDDNSTMNGITEAHKRTFTRPSNKGFKNEVREALNEEAENYQDDLEEDPSFYPDLTPESPVDLPAGNKSTIDMPVGNKSTIDMPVGNKSTVDKHLKTAKLLWEYETGINAMGKTFKEVFPQIDEKSPQERVEYLHEYVQTLRSDADLENNATLVTRGLKIDLETMVDVYQCALVRRKATKEMMANKTSNESSTGKKERKYGEMKLVRIYN